MAKRAQPKITRKAADQAIDAIAARRDRCGDPARELLPVVVEEAVEAARYVADHPAVPADVLAADTVDALTLLTYARARLPVHAASAEKLEHRLLLLGVAAGVPLKALGAPLGVASRQGAENRLLRHEAAERGLPRTDTAGRAAIRQEIRLSTWTAAHGHRVLGAARLLLAHRSELAARLEDPTDLDDLADALADAERPPGPDHWRRVRSVAMWARTILREADRDAGGAAVPDERAWQYAADALDAHERVSSPPRRRRARG